MTPPISVATFQTTVMSLYNKANGTNHTELSQLNDGQGLNIKTDLSNLLKFEDSGGFGELTNLEDRVLGALVDMTFEKSRPELHHDAYREELTGNPEIESQVGLNDDHLSLQDVKAVAKLDGGEGISEIDMDLHRGFMDTINNYEIKPEEYNKRIANLARESKN